MQWVGAQIEHQGQRCLRDIGKGEINMVSKKGKSRYPDRQGLSPYGGNIKPIVENGGCSLHERAMCLQMRAENEPESMMTEIQGVLKCPACGFTVNWGNE